MLDPKQLPARSKSDKKKNRRLFEQLKRKKDGEVDALFQEAHEEAFSHIDCLNCANCCKTTGPLFTERDINRISKHLKIKASEFILDYLRVDEEEDYVLQQVPCTFLQKDNRCSIYEVRPKACREYPHTDMSGQKKLFRLTMKNASICPAIPEILETVRKSSSS